MTGLDPGVEFRALGPLELLVAGRIVGLGSAKLRLTLAALLLHANEVVSADRLVDILWGDEPPETAIGTVQSLVYRLRRLLTPADGAARGDDILVTRAPGYLLRVQPSDYDVARFEQLLADARRHVDPAAALAALDEALALWRGAAFAEFAFDEFARAEAARLEELRMTAIEDQVDAKLRLGRHTELVGELEQAVSTNLVRERLRAELMLALYRSGREVEALRTYQNYRVYLAEELGLEPSASLRRLEEQMLQHDADLEWTAPVSEPGSPPMPVASTLPTGTVTFLFTDLEDSTPLWDEHPTEMSAALARHDALLRAAIAKHGGQIVKMRGDGVHAVFRAAPDAVAMAADALRALAEETWGATGPLAVRVGIHTGTAELREGDYYGTAVNRASRIMAAAHGGQVLVSQASAELVRDSLTDELELLDLGEHRLRGLARAEHLYQLSIAELRSRFPPLRTLDAVAAVAVPATSFYGRADELAKLSSLVARSGTVTLVGPGGVGKTRLAVELATEAGHRFRDGVRMIDLAPIRSDAVAAAVAAGLGLVRRGRRSFRDSILEWLGRKHMLLVVDNCEHVLGVVGPLIREVVETSSEVTVLCTSRQPLGFLGEVIFAVKPLGLPLADDTDSIENSPAVRLFADRAAAARQGLQVAPEQLELVAEICRRLDGIPLAVELAAARARSMSLPDLLAHLHPASPLLATPTPDHPRHATLLSTIQWSYDLLTPESKRLFERLSVFSGSWTLEAARSVCADGTSEQDVLSLLADLADRSMVDADFGHAETRYRMLSTLRDFAADRLSAADAADGRTRHAAFYAGIAQAGDAGLRTADEANWVARLGADFGNLHATHLWAIENADVDLEALLLVSLWNYGLQRLSAEYFRWVDQAFDKLSFDDHPRLADLKGIVALGAWLRGDLRQTMGSCRSAFDAEQRLGSGVTLPARMAIILTVNYTSLVGDPAFGTITAEVPSRFLEVVEWSRALGDPFWLGYSMDTGSFGMVMGGELERAEKLAGRALELARHSGCPTSVAYALFAVAMALGQSHSERAEPLLDESVRAARAVESRLVLGLSMSLLATMRRRLGRPLDALPLLLELLDHWDRLEFLPQLWNTVRESAICLGLLGEDQIAVHLLASVERVELVMPLLPVDRADASELSEQLRERLGDDAFGDAWTAGMDLTREVAVELATRGLVDARDKTAQVR